MHPAYLLNEHVSSAHSSAPACESCTPGDEPRLLAERARLQRALLRACARVMHPAYLLNEHVSSAHSSAPACESCTPGDEPRLLAERARLQRALLRACALHAGHAPLEMNPVYLLNEHVSSTRSSAPALHASYASLLMDRLWALHCDALEVGPALSLSHWVP